MLENYGPLVPRN